MKAATFQGVHEVKVLEVPKPSIHSPDEALLKVTLGAICGSDLHAYHGRIPMVAGELLGHEFVGVIQEVGPAVKRFKPGDRVFYAGSILRPGSNAELQLVDERIVGPAPKSLSSAEAAALPLTAITAWEMLFDRFDVRRPVPGGNDTILIIGGAGGVGSIAIQLARRASLSLRARAAWVGARKVRSPVST